MLWIFLKHLFFGPWSKTEETKVAIGDRHGDVKAEETIHFGIFHSIRLLEDVKFPHQSLAVGSTGTGCSRKAAVTQLQNMVYHLEKINAEIA